MNTSRLHVIGTTRIHCRSMLPANCVRSTATMLWCVLSTLLILVGEASPSNAQEFEFRQRLSKFIDDEANLEGFCVRVDALHLRMEPNKPVQSEAQTSYLVVDRLADAIRLDTQVSRETEDGATSTDSYRYLRRRNEVYYASGAGPLFRSTRSDVDVMQSLNGRPNNPFEAIFCGTMSLPDAHWKQSMRGIESFFDLDKISATRFERDKVVGLVQSTTGHTICEIEFDMKSSFGMSKVTTYINHPHIDLQQPSRNTLPYMVATCEWKPYQDICVPSHISIRLSMGTQERQFKTETEIFYSWFDGTVPSEILQPDDVATNLDQPARLQRLLAQ